MDYQRKKMIKKVIHWIAILFLIAALIRIGYVGYKYFDNHQTTQQTKEIAGDNGDIFVPDFAGLKQLNKDVTGYLYYPKLDISHPILQGKTNDTYLYTDINGNYSEFGSVFLDSDNKSNYSDKNNIIYGHTVFGWTGMFTRIQELTNKEVFDSAKTFILYTPNQNYRCEVFALFAGEPGEELYQIGFERSHDFTKWIKEVKRRSLYTDPKVVVSKKDKIVSLSTCSQRYGSGRYIVYAKMTPDNEIVSTDVQ